MKHLLRTFDDPVLKQVCIKVTPGDDLSFIPEMIRICLENGGCGLAAPQIGITKRVIIVESPPCREVMLNPVIVHSEGRSTDREGCLSYPGVHGVEIARAKKIRVEWLDLDFKPRAGSFKRLPARIIQHEIDHLNGVCLVGDAWRFRLTSWKTGRVSCSEERSCF